MAANSVLELQRVVGNRAVARILARQPQTKPRGFHGDGKHRPEGAFHKAFELSQYDLEQGRREGVASAHSRAPGSVARSATPRPSGRGPPSAVGTLPSAIGNRAFTRLLARSPAPSGPGAARVVMLDGLVLDQVNRGNRAMAQALRAMKDSGARIALGATVAKEVLQNPPSAQMRAAYAEMVRDFGIEVDPADLRTTPAQRAPHEAALSGSVVGKSDVPVVAEAMAAGAELWSTDRALRKNPASVAKLTNLHLAPESAVAPVATNSHWSYAQGRELLGLQPITVAEEHTGNLPATVTHGRAVPGTVTPGGPPVEGSVTKRGQTPRGVEPGARVGGTFEAKAHAVGVGVGSTPEPTVVVDPGLMAEESESGAVGKGRGRPGGEGGGRGRKPPAAGRLGGRGPATPRSTATSLRGGKARTGGNERRGGGQFGVPSAGQQLGASGAPGVELAVGAEIPPEVTVEATAPEYASTKGTLEGGAQALLAAQLGKMQSGEAARAYDRLEELQSQIDAARSKGKWVALKMLVQVPDSKDILAPFAGVADVSQLTYFETMWVETADSQEQAEGGGRQPAQTYGKGTPDVKETLLRPGHHRDGKQIVFPPYDVGNQTHAVIRQGPGFAGTYSPIAFEGAITNEQTAAIRAFGMRRRLTIDRAGGVAMSDTNDSTELELHTGRVDMPNGTAKASFVKRDGNQEEQYRFTSTFTYVPGQAEMLREYVTGTDSDPSFRSQWTATIYWMKL